VFFQCPAEWPIFNAPDEELDTFELSAPGGVSPTNFAVITVSGLCSPPFSFGNWAVARGIIGFLEEQVDGQWFPRESRLILNGDWPGVGGFSGGPGGGVINIVSSLVAGADKPSLLHVRPGPPAALRLGGAWRVSPTNYGENGELRFYTNFRSTSLKLPVSSTNFAIEVRPLPGFLSPASRTMILEPETSVGLDLLYLVNPPRLFLDPTGLGISGTEGTVYSLESTSSFSSPNVWRPSGTVTLGPGTSWIPSPGPAPGESNQFFRAKWLAE
jgi:hypothetical protein